MVEVVDKTRNGNTLGFSVSNAPIWLCKVLSREAKEFYNDVYWPVIVDWYKKAKLLEASVMSHECNISVQGQEEEIKIEEKKEPTVKLFGGNKGE